ncbi:MAG: cytochrome c-type biogenesis protein [Candidatus Latescibacterota bacterium]
MVKYLAFCLALAFLTSPAQAATAREIKDVAQEMVCLCGDCNRESLATCICTSFAVPQREHIGQLLDRGKSRQEIIDEYVSTYGQVALAAPPPEGYNLLAWIAPFAALLFGVFIVRSVLRNWRDTNDQEQAKPLSTSTPPIDKERERLRRELERFDESE